MTVYIWSWALFPLIKFFFFSWMGIESENRSIASENKDNLFNIGSLLIFSHLFPLNSQSFADQRVMDLNSSTTFSVETTQLKVLAFALVKIFFMMSQLNSSQLVKPCLLKNSLITENHIVSLTELIPVSRFNLAAVTLRALNISISLTA